MLLYVGTVLCVRTIDYAVSGFSTQEFPSSLIERHRAAFAAVDRLIGYRLREISNPSLDDLPRDALCRLHFFAGANWRVAPCPERAIEFRAHTHAQSMHLDESGYAYALNVSGVERWIKRERRGEGREGKKADVATCLRHLIGNHGALPPLGCVVRHQPVWPICLFSTLLAFALASDETVNLLCGASTRVTRFADSRAFPPFFLFFFFFLRKHASLYTDYRISSRFSIKVNFYFNLGSYN